MSGIPKVYNCYAVPTKQDTQFIDYDFTAHVGSSDRFNFTIDCNWPVSIMEVQIGAVCSSNFTGMKLVTSDLVGACANLGVLGTFRNSTRLESVMSNEASRLKYYFDQPVQLAGSHYFSIYEGDGSPLASVCEGTLQMNFKFYGY